MLEFWFARTWLSALLSGLCNQSPSTPERESDKAGCDSLPGRSTVSFLGQNEFGLAHRKRIVSGKNEVERSPVSADPFCRKRCRIARADIPMVGVKHDAPRTPWP